MKKEPYAAYGDDTALLLSRTSKTTSVVEMVFLGVVLAGCVAVVTWSSVGSNTIPGPIAVGGTVLMAAMLFSEVVKLKRTWRDEVVTATTVTVNADRGYEVDGSFPVDDIVAVYRRNEDKRAYIVEMVLADGRHIQLEKSIRKDAAFVDQLVDRVAAITGLPVAAPTKWPHSNHCLEAR